MQLTFLNASVPLTKSYNKLPDGTVEKTSYPNVWEVSSISEDVTDLPGFMAAITKHAKLGNCLLKGNVLRPLIKESRKDSTDRNATTEFLCLDIDGIDPNYSYTVEQADPATGAKTQVTQTAVLTVETVLNSIGLKDVSYILQWSGSMGISNNSLRCHVFVMLSKAMSAPLIKQWLIQKNHESAILRSHQKLTKTGNSLLWGLDITACQADKLIYISDPVLKGIRNPLGKQPRVSLVKKAQDTFDLNCKINGTDQNRALTDARVLELRDQDGLPKRKLTYKIVGPHEVLVKPGECIATEMKIDRGFVYFNINGGDSWAYYHPENNPDYIFNFKGEPVYLTKELLPAYWESLQTQAYRVTSTGLIHLAFLERFTSTYYRGTYDPDADVLDILPAKNESMVRQYADANGLRLGNNIPEWTMSFNPDDAVRVDFDNRTVNTFERTVYMKEQIKKVTKCPPKIFSIISHILADDIEAIEHFMNWVACIAQNRTRTRTAWVFQGTQGTGKGILFERVLAPLFGVNQTVMKRSSELNEKWTDFVEGKFIVFIDEIQTSALQDESGAIATMKNLITNATAMIRSMMKNSYPVNNFTNWIFASNKADPVNIPKNDRRFNVGPYQALPFPKPTDEWLDSIEDELQSFHSYLMGYAVDKEAAATPLDNAARTTLIALSQTTAESTAFALIEGDLPYFIDQLPTDDKYKTDMQKLAKVSGYRRTLYDILVRTKPDGTCNVSRDELFTIFDYTVGGMNPSPTSFSKYLGHRQIEIKPVSIAQKIVRGIQTTWKNPITIASLIKTHFNDMSTKPATQSQPVSNVRKIR